MKTGIICLLLPLILLGCVKKTPEMSVKLRHPLNQPIFPIGAIPGMPFATKVVESVETRELNNISNQAVVMLQAKDYDGLDALAKKLRDSKQCSAAGCPKFCYVYCGLCLPDKAPDAQWTNRLAALQDWINSRTNSITARVAMANDLVCYAWKARGDGWADTVTEEGWRLFGERLNQAVKVLDEAKSLPEKCPYWWSVLFETDLGLSVDRSQYDASFEEATRAWPDYDPYYHHRAWYLMPRWYGTNGEWESDLEKSADRRGGEAGDLLYARVVWCQHQTHSYSNIIKECNLSWPRVNKGFEVMENQFPNSLAAKSEHAYLAVLARDATVARKEFDQLKGRMDLSVWPNPARFVVFAYWTYSPDHKFPGQ
jgi:Domain of unknown function (DUF4034)